MTRRAPFGSEGHRAREAIGSIRAIDQKTRIAALRKVMAKPDAIDIAITNAALALAREAKAMRARSMRRPAS